MGAPSVEGYNDERPRHRAAVPDLFLGRGPITQAQWRAVMGTLPPCRNRGAAFPVDRVSWHDAQSFCTTLSEQTRRRYRLPGETEWEYACRAQSTSPFNTGPTVITDLANYVGVHTYADESPGLYRHHTTEAGLFPPNDFGLFDMHGNVWEWCADVWHDSYEGAPADGRPWLQGADTATATLRVLRGGCWHDPPNLCRSAARLKSSAGEAEDYFGLRVALSSLQQEPVPGAPLRRLAHSLHLSRGRE
jgi:formylglycine-generating enzyme required for sulfatase activity